jgi:hypothetical protein
MRINPRKAMIVDSFHSCSHANLILWKCHDHEKEEEK